MKKLLILLVVPLVPMFVEAQSGPSPTWCSDRTNNYCTYAFSKLTRCCYPTYISPGAYCPQICL